MTIATPTTSPMAARHRRAFSLVEVLMAVMILGIGLIMITSVFPVGANWTRQNLEETIGSIVARNAVAIIQTKYTSNDFPAATFTPGLPLALPGMNNAAGKLPITERVYRFGTNMPYPPPGDPANNITPFQQAQGSTYFWTAVIRKALPANMPNSFDLYIFVFKKGDAGQTFTSITQELQDASNNPTTRDMVSNPKEDFVPYIAGFNCTTVSAPGNPDPRFTLTGLPASIKPEYLVGSQVTLSVSGGVYRIIGYNPANGRFTLNANAPVTVAGDQILYAPPADGTTTSPLVYIYQTTISF